MPVFAVQYTYVDDPAVVTEHRPAHRDFLRDLLDRGIVLAAGAYTDGPAGALLVFRGDTEQDIAALLAKDPFQQLGLVQGLPGQGVGSGDGPLGRLSQPSNSPTEVLVSADRSSVSSWSA